MLVKPTRTPRRRWEDNIRKSLKEIGINTKSWIDLVQDRDYWRVVVNGTFEPPDSKRVSTIL